MTTENPSVDFTFDLVAGAMKPAMKEAGASSGDLWMVPPSQLVAIDGFNTRVKNDRYRAHIDSLKASIKAGGYQKDKPIAGIVLKDDDGNNVIHYYDGHCRMDAVNELVEEGVEIERVPVVLAPQGTSLEDITIGLVRSNTGMELTPYEKGITFKRLLGYGLSEQQIADRLGFTKQYVSDLLVLHGSPVAIRNMVEQDQVSAALAIETIKKHGKKAGEKLKEAAKVAKAMGKGKVTKKHVNVGGVATMTFAKFAKAKAPEFANLVTEITDDPAYASLSEDLRTKIDTLADEAKRMKEALGEDRVPPKADATSSKEESEGDDDL